MGLELRNISKSWRGFELKNVDVKVENGDYFIIIGPTGAGKTLLLETIMGFQKPDQGDTAQPGVRSSRAGCW